MPIAPLPDATMSKLSPSAPTLSAVSARADPAAEIVFAPVPVAVRSPPVPSSRSVPSSVRSLKVKTVAPAVNEMLSAVAPPMVELRIVRFSPVPNEPKMPSPAPVLPISTFWMPAWPARLTVLPAPVVSVGRTLSMPVVGAVIVEPPTAENWNDGGAPEAIAPSGATSMPSPALSAISTCPSARSSEFAPPALACSRRSIRSLELLSVPSTSTMTAAPEASASAIVPGSAKVPRPPVPRLSTTK
jgi:hypothetical protein